MASRGRKNESETVEARVVEGFLKFLEESRGVRYRIVGKAVVVGSGKNYDFELAPEDARLLPVAVEVFRLVDSEEKVEGRRKHGYYWAALKSALARLKVTRVLVSFPMRFGVIPRDAARVAHEHAAKIKDAVDRSPGAEEVKVGHFTVKAAPAFDTAVLSSHEASWVDAAETAAVQFAKNLPKKDGQLAVAGHERVVLVANWTSLVEVEDAIRAVASADTSQLENIDAVYLEDSKSGFRRVYSRTVRNAFTIGEGVPASDAELLNSWIQARIAAKDDRAVLLVRRLADQRAGLAWLSDRHTRVEFIRRVTELTKSEDTELGRWAAGVARFDPDPDPATSDVGVDDGIVTVRGSVCWLLQALVLRAELGAVPEILAQLEPLARDESEAVRCQAVVPLIELAVRRRSRDAAEDYAYPAAVRAGIKSLALTMLRENHDRPSVLNRLAQVFIELHDLTSEEASEALDVFVPRAEREGLEAITWFAIWLAEYANEDQPDFDREPFRLRLLKMLTEGPPPLGATIAFHIASAVKVDMERARRLLPYCPVIPREDSPPHLHHQVFEIAMHVLADEWNDDVERALTGSIRAILGQTQREDLRFGLYRLPEVLALLGRHQRWEKVEELARAALAESERLYVDWSKLASVLREARPDLAQEVTRRVSAAARAT